MWTVIYIDLRMTPNRRIFVNLWCNITYTKDAALSLSDSLQSENKTPGRTFYAVEL